jgi:AraC-like DNA-binding protein
MSWSSSCSVEYLAHVCQVLAGRALDWLEPPDPTSLSSAFEPIESPTIELHALAMERVLVLMAVRLAVTIQRNFQRRFPGAAGKVTQPVLEPIRDPQGLLLVRETVYRWACEYRQQFMAAHDSPAHRARRLIDDAQGGRATVNELAKAVVVGPRTLERQFRREIGVSIRAYRTGRRLSKAVRRLHSDTDCVEAIALDAGWSSKKGLYDALYDVAGLTPGDVRQLNAAEADRLILQLDGPAAPEREASAFASRRRRFRGGFHHSARSEASEHCGRATRTERAGSLPRRSSKSEGGTRRARERVGESPPSPRLRRTPP